MKKTVMLLCAILVLLAAACACSSKEDDPTESDPAESSPVSGGEGAPDASAGDSSLDDDSLYLDDGTEYQFTITAGEGGTIPAGMDANINGMYHAGSEIKLIMRPHPDFVFDHWESSGGGKFINPKDPGTIFIMPACDTTVTAIFVPVG